ncbi:MAG: FHA domain-containing protein [Isosphaeraceae bacterium]
MKVQLVVVRGKPEGKVIPLVGSSFKIGRGETCHLRPNSEQVSREHAEFSISDNAVIVRDLGSRNGTLVNGKALTAEYRLKDRDLVQVGPLTFAVSISDVPAPAAKAAPAQPAPAAKAAAPAPVKAQVSPDDVSGDEIDSWLFGDSGGLSADKPTTVYGGDTITITAFKDASASPPKAPPPPSASDDEYERQPEEEEEVDEAAETADAILSDKEDAESEEESEDEDEDEEAEVQEEFLDESNPFYAAKKAQKEQAKAGPAKPSFKDTSDAAGDILRRLMERRRAEKNG